MQVPKLEAKRISLILELGFREPALPQLKSYIDLLWAANVEMNLFSRKMSFEDLIDNHLIDCLLPLKKFPANLQAVADFGSGGGLPAVVYALQFPETTFHLFEKSKMKQTFLRRCQILAPNLKVHGEIPLKLVDIELVIARAFKPIDVILEISRDFYFMGGKYFLLKGRLEKIEEDLALARKKMKDIDVRIEPLHSPLLEVERHLVELTRGPSSSSEPPRDETKSGQRTGSPDLMPEPKKGR